jgi:PPOX class probable F420-dependent enzyme
VTVLTADDRALLAARRAVLATTGADGAARLVPLCFILADDGLWSPLDEKPKAVGDPRDLARVRDIAARPRVTLLVDRWSEDWTQLTWLRVLGTATLVEPADVPPGIVPALRAKYPPYRDQRLEALPMVRITIDRVVRWAAAEG